MKKIVILDGYAANPGDLEWDGFDTLGELIIYPRTQRNEIVERAKDAEIVLTNKTPFRAEIFDQLPQLKYIGVLSTGYNIIDTEAAKQHGVVVCNIPAYSTNSVAQMVFAHILNITNHVAHYAEASRKGVWSMQKDFCYWDTPLMELNGKTLGIIGLGSIGMRVAEIAHSFGMNVSAYTSKNPSELPEWIQKATLDGIFAVSDILSLHCPLTEDTRHIVHKETLAKMHPGAILINTSRGPLVNEDDVAEALNSGHLAGYGTDVMEQEPPAADNPLLKQPRAFVTPHVAWATTEARKRLMDIALQNLKAFIDGQPMNVVNP